MKGQRDFREKLCFIKVRNVDTGVVYRHSMVPYSHVMNFKLSPNLEVEILKTMGGSNSDRRREHGVKK